MDKVPILIINLPERTDRLENIKNELKNYNYIVMEAVKTKLGCNLSHQKCYLNHNLQDL